MAGLARLHRPALESEFRAAADRLRALVRDTCLDTERNTLVARPGSKDLDASLLQALPLRFFRKDDPLVSGTIDAVVADLSIDGWLQRYRGDDGFGSHRVAFTICSFWLVQALTTAGRIDEARSPPRASRGAGTESSNIPLQRDGDARRARLADGDGGVEL